MLQQQLNTIVTLLFSKWINTGDKILDTTIVGVLVIFLSYVGVYLNGSWRDYLNLWLFYYNRMYQHPLDWKKCSYIINYFRYETFNEFYEQTNGSLVRVWNWDINDKLYGKGFDIKLEHTDVGHYILKLIEDNNVCAMKEKKSGNELGNRNIYPLAISKYGNIVYYDSGSGDFLASSGRDTKYIMPFIYDYIIDSAIHSKTHMKESCIWVPKFESNIMELKLIGDIHKKKTFDTLYYPQKSELISMLTKFQTKTLYPSHIPMDNKLGILLYGPPGTGKTGTISAIANMLGRGIIVINFTEIRTCEELDAILTPTNNKRCVYVFDEFDCILDVISGNRVTEKKEEKTDWGNLLLYAEGDERKKILDMMRDGRGRTKDAPIDMMYLLQKLDGLESAEDRLIIATTNNPDKINSALLRPGRFDLKICLGLCTKSMIVDILTNFHQGDDDMRHRIMKVDIPEQTYSPLEVINMAIQTPDFNTLLLRLRRGGEKIDTK
jgi:hypothetical protein